MQKRMFVFKVLQMSMSMIILNFSSIYYNIYISQKSGARGIGLFHLIMSVYSVAISLSVSGISITATRLLSDMPKDKAMLNSEKILNKCMQLSICTSLVASFLLYSFAGPISEKIIGEKSCTGALKTLASTLIYLGISSPINGFFTAFGMVSAISFSKLCGEIVLWLVTVILFENHSALSSHSIPITAHAASVATETLVTLLLRFKNRFVQSSKTFDINISDVICLCAPFAVGSILRTGLASTENLLIPLRLGAGNVNNALSKYGILKGMVLPVVMSSGVFVSAFCTLIVPETARRNSVNSKKSICHISSLSVEYISKFSICVSAILFLWHDTICNWFFAHSEASKYLRMLSLLPAAMFFDSVTDTILKGMNQQFFSLKLNAVDSLVRVLLIYFLIPSFKIEGYIFILYFSELVNLSFSYHRLKKITALRFPICRAVIHPISAVVISGFTAFLIPDDKSYIQIIVFIVTYSLVCMLSTKVASVFRQERTSTFPL